MMMNISRLLALTIFTSATLVAVPAFSEGSPWLPTPSTGSLSLSYVHQSADEFYRKSSKVPTPGGGEDLEQSTLWLQTSYGLADAIAVDARLGWARSEYVNRPGLPVEQKSYDGLVDINAGLTWRVVDEAVSELPSIALRAAVIIDGGYTTGYINSLGDGGNGAEASLLVGKFLSDRFALSGEIGYRTRNNNIPDNTFFKLSGGVILAQGWALNAGYEQTDTGSGLDIGGPGFHPSRFPELREESQLLSAGLSFATAQGYNLGFVYGTTLDGRNVGDFEFYGLSLDYSFDTF